jgi:coniferyl-aldehyde dehydrogenase
MTSNTEILGHLEASFHAQKKAQSESGAPDYTTRIDRLNRLLDLVLDKEQQLLDAMDADFGGRCHMLSMGLDLVPVVIEIKQARKHLKKWMRAERRSVNSPLGLVGAKARLVREPKGVIGNMVTWNFPVNLAFAPLVGILAGGNRAIIKMHEFSPELTRVMGEAIAECFDETEVALIGGGQQVSMAFSGLPFDHIVFTGSTNIGKKVMAAAANNLAPVTLELGGKCPVLVSRTADLNKVATRVIYGKMTNAGQICLAPDYLLAPEELAGHLVKKMVTECQRMLPNAVENQDYTAIISKGHYNRLQGLISDAEGRGAKITRVDATSSEAGADVKKISLHILQNVSGDMEIMQEEIFGPLLPVIPYKCFDEAIDYLRGGEKPLASYYFGSDKSELDKVLKFVPSGATTVNDTLFHALQHDLPFGGVGASGMGSYHGKAGFDEFTNPRAVFTQGWFDVGGLMRPPFKPRHKKILRSMM